MQAARHIGAHYVLHTSQSLPIVTEALGHASPTCARYYIDFWNPQWTYSAVADLVVAALARILSADTSSQ